jgi:hypothetical protein
VGPRAGLDVCENLASTGIRSPDRPSRSQSLYRLSYPAHTEEEGVGKIFEMPSVQNVKDEHRNGQTILIQ